MRRNEIIRQSEAHLKALGFQAGSWLWTPGLAQLTIVIAGNIKVFTLKSGMSKRAFTYSMGKLDGLAEAYGLAVMPRAAHRANGHSSPHQSLAGA